MITGGAGYIGSYITRRLLEANLSVRVLDTLWFDKSVPNRHKRYPNYEFIKGDIRNKKLVREALEGIDYVLHAAAIVGEPASNKFPNLTKEINYQASIALIDAAEGAEVKGLVFFSTCSNYGIAEGIVDETAPLKPMSLYSQTKIDTEKYLMENTKNLKWVICRLATVYGCSERMRFDLTVNDFVLKAVMKKYLDIFFPNSKRPYIHISDLAHFIQKLLNNFYDLQNNVFNVGFNNENYKKIYIAEIIKRFLPDTCIEIVKDGTDLRDYAVNFSKIEKNLDVKNEFNVNKGVSEILHSLRKNMLRNPNEAHYYNTQPDLKEVLNAEANRT